MSSSSPSPPPSPPPPPSAGGPPPSADRPAPAPARRIGVTPPVLAVTGLAVRAGAERILAGISFALERGASVGLTAPSGMGKTTLLRALALLDDPAEGALALDGRPPEAYGHPGWRRRVVYVAQEPPVHDDTVRACLERPFAFKGAARSLDLALAEDLLARLGLEPAAVLARRARTLSVGERQRMGIVRALVLEPRVLLLDEPTSALDADTARRALDLVTGYAEAKGAAVLVVTHDAALAERHLERTLDVARWRSPTTGGAGPEGERAGGPGAAPAEAAS